MFAVELVTDTVSIPASELHTHNTRALLHSYIDRKYPNRVLMDAGLVIGRYDPFRLQTGPATLAAGGRGAVYQCTFAVIVFRPWTGEVLVGRIVAADAEGLTVSTGFFACIHVPKRWMLNPSTYKDGVWVWTPVFDDDEVDGESEGFEMYIGAEIRCRVKSIHFTQVTNTAKGVQAVTSMQGMSNEPSNKSGVVGGKDTPDQQPVRRRSSSVGVQAETATASPTMQIIASIREDGLGLVEWWNTEDEEDETVDAEESATAAEE